MKPSLIVIGLGNPGKAYERTRHNAGFQALDQLAREFGEGEWTPKQKFQADVMEGRIVTVPILLVKPQTYMNLSGDTARKLVDFYKIDPKEQLLVISDDIDLPLGELRFRDGGGPGTHNGMRSIVDTLGEGFPRIRIGLGEHPTGEELASWVVSVPSPEDAETLRNAMGDLPKVVQDYVLNGSKKNPAQ